jgi:hypothetical protein
LLKQGSLFLCSEDCRQASGLAPPPEPFRVWAVWFSAAKFSGMGSTSSLV